MAFKKKLVSMAVSHDENHIALAEDYTVTIIENPIKCTEPRIYGPGYNYLDYMKYISDCMLGNAPPHDPGMDLFIIQPFRINALHIYAYFNLPKHLK